MKGKAQKENKVKSKNQDKKKTGNEVKNKDMVKTKTKEKKPNKFIETIKKKWLIDGSKTILLVAIIIALFFGINIGIQKLNPIPIDLSQEKLFSLTEATKDKVKNIEKQVNMYFVEYEEDDSTLDLARQYQKVNPNIKVEAIKTSQRQDLVEKYEVSSGTTSIIVECGEKSKILGSDELVTYDYSTYEEINVAEEKLTAAIQSVSTDDVPKVYFLSGYSDISLNNGLECLNLYLENEVNQVETVDVLTTGKVPDDCDTLVITMPSKDFDELATNAIIEYINAGGNILWFQAATAIAADTPNINKILAVYGIKPFQAGIVIEGDTSKMLSGYPDLILPTIQSSEVTEKLNNENGVILLDATKINVMNSEELTNLNVTQTNLLTTSSNSYFKTNFESESDEGEEKGTFTVGALMEKTLSEANEETGEKAKTSKLIIYGEAAFISDTVLPISSQGPMIMYRQNKDLALNSIAYLVNREEDIVARKSTGTVTYTATEQENNVILAIIFIVPVVVVIVGIVVWILRRRKK